jgi:hypothetical protein
MTTQPEIPPLSSLEFLPYLDSAGLLPTIFQGKVGVYAIFNQDKVLQYIGYSRDVSLSLKQHLVRCPQQTYWLKVQTIDRPSRTALEEIRQAWLAENGTLPPGHGEEEARWNEPIDAKGQMTDSEKHSYVNAVDELSQIKILKQVARRVEADILENLKIRGVQEGLRFNPKLKEVGLLDLK